jgi:hypothetical protein
MSLINGRQNSENDGCDFHTSMLSMENRLSTGMTVHCEPAM